MTNTILSVKNLCVKRKDVVLIKDFYLDVKEKEIIGIVGQSGCGKTTFAHALLQLDNNLISTGEALFANTNLLQLSPKEIQHIRAKKISMVFQDPNSSLNPTMKIGKQIQEVLQANFSLKNHTAKEQTLLIMQKAGIPLCELRYHQYPHELSGGLKQRVMIAIAIAANPKILIADEPTTALDVTTQSQILQLFKSLTDMSIIFISHDIKLLFYLCNRIFIMHELTIIEQDTPKNLLISRHPYTKMLLETSFHFDARDLCKKN